MFELIRSNKRRSAVLIAAFMAIVVVVGTIIGLLFGNGPLFAGIALVVGAAIAFGSYWNADKIALRVSRAHPASPEEYARLAPVNRDLGCSRCSIRPALCAGSSLGSFERRPKPGRRSSCRLVWGDRHSRRLPENSTPRCS